ncbi:hypothetical protein [Desulfomarina sp.]
MDPIKRIDKILEAVQVRVQDEVASLLGVDFLLENIEKQPVTKEEVFDALVGKQICARMELVGEVEGNGALLIGIKDAIRLGGTLIMLPASELDEVISREEYSEEIEDSYGEIANIIAGSFTKDFEEMYPKSFRFVRKEQEKLVPVKVDIESDEPVKNEIFYQVAFSMILDGAPMGKMVMLMPAASLGLHWEDKVVSLSDTAPVEQNSAEEQEKDEEINTEVESDATAETVKPNFNVEKHKKRIDRLLTACQEKMSAELGALLGVDIALSDLHNSFVSKEEFFFDHASGKQVLADMEVVGDLEDRSFFSISLKDAIYLGGLLIMLPPSELENVVSEEDFGEEAQDAYGEVANIVSGVYTSVFEEQYTKNLRFIRKELQQVVPMKVDPESDEPVPDVPYYLSSMTLNIEGKSYGKVHMLFPVELLQLSSFGQPQAQVVEEAVVETAPENENRESAPAPSEKKADFNIERHRKRVDKLLGLCQEKMADEVGALLGVDVQLLDQENRIVNKEDFFFEEVSGKQIIADMEVVGEIEDKSYLVISQKDAIRIGGTLIMLPENELQSSVEDGDFSEDIEDAYGEIANIISGVYTAVFEEGYTRQIRFIKKDLHQVLPMKVDPESEEPFPDQEYYVSSMKLVLGGNEAGKVHMVFPSIMLQLDGLGAKEQEQEAEARGTAHSVSSGSNGESSRPAPVAADDGRRPIDILLIGDDMTEIEKLQSVFGKKGFEIRVLSFKDEVHNYIPGELKAVYLVMREINEQGFGVAIKVSSSCSLPLIAAAPGWTKTKVIKAVKYGIRDILLTPATTEDIEENIDNNLLKMAA